MEELMYASGTICIPGMRLGKLDKDFVSGPGTHDLQGYLYTNLAGVLKMEKDETNAVTVVSVQSPRTPSILPKTGDIVTAKVTIVNPRMVQCTIICVGPLALVRPYRGILKREEIRSTDKDRIDPYKCYRPGDVILAKVLPMIESHWYPLSTAENELGVAIASAEGAPQGVSMVPINWSEMQCPKTLAREPRKVARIMPENILEKSPTAITSAKSSSKKISNEIQEVNNTIDQHILENYQNPTKNHTS